MDVLIGFLSPSAKYGAIPKVLGAVAFGYFLGKFSYQNKCAQKLMQLPNSRLAQILRQRKFGDLERCVYKTYMFVYSNQIKSSN